MSCSSATSLTTVLKVMMLSAVVSASAYRRSISFWPGAALVVAELDRDAHRLEHGDRRAAEVVAVAVGHVVEVAGVVDRLRAAALLPVLLDEEELDLRVGVEGEAQLGRPRQGAAQHLPRVGEARRAVRHLQVAEHAGGAGALAAPRQHLERRGVGLGEHVRLEDPRETLDGRAVEPDPLGERPLELRGRDRHRLERAEDVGEPQPHEADVALLDRPEHELLLAVHVPILPHLRVVL